MKRNSRFHVHAIGSVDCSSTTPGIADHCFTRDVELTHHRAGGVLCNQPVQPRRHARAFYLRIVASNDDEAVCCDQSECLGVLIWGRADPISPRRNRVPEAVFSQRSIRTKHSVITVRSSVGEHLGVGEWPLCSVVRDWRKRSAILGGEGAGRPALVLPPRGPAPATSCPPLPALEL